jgi:hypothetical protein
MGDLGASTSQSAELQDDDLPTLHTDFNRTSVAAQRRYLRLMKSNLAVLVIASLFSSYTSSDARIQQWFYGGGAFMFGCSLILTLVIVRRGFERTWYGGRAGAESVKSLAWKYMTRAKPFGPDQTDQAADQEFASGLATILRARRDLSIVRSNLTEVSRAITPRMRQIREQPLLARLRCYYTCRIQDQERWYSEKASENARREGLMFGAIVLAQVSAFAAMIYQAITPGVTLNLGGVLAVIAAALLAWLQLKRHQELAQSYALTVHELGFVATRVPHVGSEIELSDFVSDTENAISREHTMWVARRDTNC